jgi:hypothetical protein
MQVNSRVQVKISNPSEWNFFAEEGLDGALGIIEEVKDYSFTDTPIYLVRLDKPVTKWGFTASPEDSKVTHWHFSEKDLVEVS